MKIEELLDQFPDAVWLGRENNEWFCLWGKENSFVWLPEANYEITQGKTALEAIRNALKELKND